ncbi:hypothetical protein C5167_041831 [Papaver somniferum]|nr:hypothetical protein C5167_041831 [Papaver somniferum]
MLSLIELVMLRLGCVFELVLRRKVKSGECLVPFRSSISGGLLFQDVQAEVDCNVVMAVILVKGCKCRSR